MITAAEVFFVGLYAVLVAVLRLARWAAPPVPRPNPALALWQQLRAEKGEFPDVPPRHIARAISKTRKPSRSRRKSR